MYQIRRLMRDTRLHGKNLTILLIKLRVEFIAHAVKPGYFAPIFLFFFFFYKNQWNLFQYHI